MKRVVILLSICFLFCISTIYSQNLEGKSYSDLETGYSGWAGTIFLGSDYSAGDTAYEEMCNTLPEGSMPVTKLTKQNKWLLSQALSEWDYEPGECYVVILTESRSSDSGVVLIVYISDDFTYSWKGFVVSDSDL